MSLYFSEQVCGKRRIPGQQDGVSPFFRSPGGNAASAGAAAARSVSTCGGDGGTRTAGCRGAHLVQAGMTLSPGKLKKVNQIQSLETRSMQKCPCFKKHYWCSHTRLRGFVLSKNPMNLYSVTNPLKVWSQCRCARKSARQGALSPRSLTLPRSSVLRVRPCVRSFGRTNRDLRDRDFENESAV